MKKRCIPKRHSALSLSLMGTLFMLFLLVFLGQRGISNFHSTSVYEPSLQRSSLTATDFDSKVPPGTTVTGAVNNTSTSWATTYDITTPGLYKFEITVESIYNPYGSYVYIQLGGSQDVYMPPLDANVLTDAYLGYMLFNPITSGDTEESMTSLPFFQTGTFNVYADLYFFSFPGTAFRFDVKLSLELDLSNAEQLDFGENNINLNIPSAPKYHSLDISEEAFYNMTIVWELDYDTPYSGYEDLATPSCIYDVTHGARKIWQHILMDDWIPSGTGIVSGQETYIFPMAPQQYIWYLQVADFTQWGGTHIDVTVFITKIDAQIITSSSSGSFTVTSDDPLEYAFLEFNPSSLYSLELSQTSGHNWRIDSNFGLSLSYQQIDSTTTIQKNSLHEFHAYQLNMMPSVSVSGLSPSYTSWRTRSLITDDGTPISANDDAGSHYHPTGHIPVRFTGSPLLDPSSNFKFTVSITEEADIPILTPSTASALTRQASTYLYGNEVSINTTIGPFYYLYRVAVQSGYQYQVTATASEYGSLGYSRVNILAPSDNENWIFIPPLVSPWSEGNYFTVNGTAGIEFVSPVTGEVFVIVYGAPYLPTMVYDTKELTVALIEKPPTPYTPNTLMTTTPNYYSTFTFIAKAGFAYLINLEISDPQGVYAIATIFDGWGNSPFDISYQELFITSMAGVPFSSSSFSSSAFADYIGGYIAKVTAVVTLMIWCFGEPVTFIVQEWQSDAVGFQFGFIFSHWFGIAITIPITFAITFVILRRRPR